MTKFNIGDKVRFIEDYSNYKIGDVVEVTGFWSEGIDFAGEHGDGSSLYERFELAELKINENQRIAALENEVAELKLIVRELRGKKSIEPSATNTVEEIIEFEGKEYKKVDREAQVGDVVILRRNTSNCVDNNKKYIVDKYRGDVVMNVGADNAPDYYLLYSNAYNRTPETVDVYELIQPKPLTPNQQRAAIIEKAKKFVEDLKDEEGKYSKTTVFGNSELIFEFVVNPEKRTVVALGRLFYYPSILKVYAKGIAKCAPNDVFNEHIGKAIALGRALGLDVSEFEQAVQPNKVVTGMKLKSTRNWTKTHGGKIHKGDIIDVVRSGMKIERKQCHANSGVGRNSKIADDTNAIY